MLASLCRCFWNWPWGTRKSMTRLTGGFARESKLTLSLERPRDPTTSCMGRVKGRGRPFLYFAYGAAVTEVVIDTLTGENRILRADLLHDTGSPLNPALDIGQIEGAYVQGAGWLTMEELIWDAVTT